MKTIETQYNEAKARYPKHLLCFKLGDYYELWNEDAKIVSRALGLTLTSRSKINPIPTTAIPAHSAESYVARLLRMGFSVAQVEFKGK